MEHPPVAHQRSSDLSFLRPAISPREFEWTVGADLADPLPPFSGAEADPFADSFADYTGGTGHDEGDPFQGEPDAQLQPGPGEPPQAELDHAAEAERPGEVAEVLPWLMEIDRNAEGGRDEAPADPSDPWEMEPATDAFAESPEEEQRVAELPSFLQEVEVIEPHDETPWLELDDPVGAEPSESVPAARSASSLPDWLSDDDGEDPVDEPPVVFSTPTPPVESPRAAALPDPPVPEASPRGEGPTLPVLEEVAARLERIAQSLRERTPAELLGSGADDPLQMLIAGYALGLSDAARPATDKRAER